MSEPTVTFTVSEIDQLIALCEHDPNMAAYYLTMHMLAAVRGVPVDQIQDEVAKVFLGEGGDG